MEEENFTQKAFVLAAKEYAKDCHEKTNHHYDEKGNNVPYSFHLSMVVDVAMEFIDLIEEQDRPNVIAACWLHDAIEDTRNTYNDVRKHTNTDTAEIVYALTNEKGRQRKDRANAAYYKGIRTTPYATFVKLCDRIANFKYSYSQGGSMMKKYADEYPNFREALYHERYKDMFFVLDKLTELANKQPA